MMPFFTLFMFQFNWAEEDVEHSDQDFITDRALSTNFIKILSLSSFKKDCLLPLLFQIF